MPDLITHVAFIHLLRRPFDLKKQIWNPNLRILFYVGTILPDILTRPFYILFPSTFSWTVAIHTFAGMFIICALIAFFFEVKIRRQVFVLLISGAAFHFLLDAFQKQLIGNNYWLFPLSWKNFGLGIFWAGEATYRSKPYSNTSPFIRLVT